jgi:hypothetical protein
LASKVEAAGAGPTAAGSGFLIDADGLVYSS